MELFLSENKEDQIKFQEQFEQIISEVPNKIANKDVFWIYFFLGSILTLPYTDLFGEQKIEVKLSDDQIDLRVTLGDKVVYRSIKAEAGQIPVIEYEDINLSNSSEFIKIVKALKQNFTLSFNKETKEGFAKNLFQNLSTVYNYYQLKQKPEALHQAFIYGFFKMNTNIECLIEFNAGLGTSDLILKTNGILIIVECKVGNKTAEDALTQIEIKGYYHLSILGRYESAFWVGVNLTQKGDKGLAVEEKKIFKPEGLISTLIRKKANAYDLEEAIEEELKFLCYTKNIGICNPDNPSNHNEADPKNKYVGSFTALVLGQVLQYYGQNDECELEHITTQLEEESKARNTEFIITDSDNKLKLNIIEFTDKGGNESPKLPATDEDISSPEREDDNRDDYNIKICITRNDEESLYKIIFSDGQVTVQEEKERSNSVKRTRSGREIKSTKDPDYVYSSSSSQESNQEPKSSPKKLPLERKRVDIERLIEEVKSREHSYLREIIMSCRELIHSEANLQLFLKGLFMNAGINEDEQIVAETEVSSGQAGEIDLLVKLPNGQGMVFECKFCEKVEEIEGSKKDAWDQLESYIDKGNLKYILGENSQLHKVAVVFCKEGPVCDVEVGTVSISLNESEVEVLSLERSDDSGFASSEDLSRTSLTPNTFLLSLLLDSIPSSNSVPSSPGTKRKEMSPDASPIKQSQYGM